MPPPSQRRTGPTPAVRPGQQRVGRRCAFCGRHGGITGEHVFPRWLTGLGLDPTPTGHAAGPLNRSPRQWVDRPFNLVVRAVCAECNNGWLSRWEGAARPVLTPLVHGRRTELSPDDLQKITAWSFKTALVALLAASSPDRASTPGLPEGEYHLLFDARDLMAPPPDAQCWIGRYAGGRRASSVWVVPHTVDLERGPANDRPSAYVFTLVLGHFLVHGVRFTNPWLRVGLRQPSGLVPAWPGAPSALWPPAADVDDGRLDVLNRGKDLDVEEAGVRMAPFGPAVDLPAGQLSGKAIHVPTPCGRHTIAFPAVLAAMAVSEGAFHVFTTACECGKAYLVETVADGSHFRMEGNPKAIVDYYESFPGEEAMIQDEEGTFFCKRSLAPLDLPEGPMGGPA